MTSRTSPPWLSALLVIFLLLAATASSSRGAQPGQGLPTISSDDDFWVGYAHRLVGSTVNTMTVFNGDLILGGAFYTADGVTCTRIARWNGTTWDSLRSGLNADPYCMAVYNGDLYVGGGFTTAGGSSAVGIARWDGTSWHDVGGGVSAPVYSMTVWNGSLVVAGAFWAAGGVNLPNQGIASWNGSGWSGFPGFSHANGVSVVGVYNNKLILTGYFTFGPGQYIQSWDGTNQSSLGSGVDSYVQSLVNYDGKLIAGGNFVHAGGQDARFIAQWDGTAWSPMGQGFGPGNIVTSQSVYTLTVENAVLFAGGGFGTADGLPAANVAAWDGTRWTPLGSGTDYGVYGSAVYNNSLYVGGGFQHAGGKYSELFARWDGPGAVGVPGLGASGGDQRVLLMPAAPNPFGAATTLRLELPGAASVSARVYDVSGRLVRELANGSILPAGSHAIRWDGHDESGRVVAEGIYFSRIQAGTFQQVDRLVFVR